MRVRVTTVAVENSVTYSECVCVCVALVIQHVLSMRRYLINGKICGGRGELLNITCVFFSTTFLRIISSSRKN